MKIGYYRTWHVLHLLMSIFTGGLWIPIWILCIIHNSWRNSRPKMELNRALVRQQQEILDSLQQGRIEENERILSLLRK